PHGQWSMATFSSGSSPIGTPCPTYSPQQLMSLFDLFPAFENNQYRHYFNQLDLYGNVNNISIDDISLHTQLGSQQCLNTTIPYYINGSSTPPNNFSINDIALHNQLGSEQGLNTTTPYGTNESSTEPHTQLGSEQGLNTTIPYVTNGSSTQPNNFSINDIALH